MQTPIAGRGGWRDGRGRVGKAGRPESRSAGHDESASGKNHGDSSEPEPGDGPEWASALGSEPDGDAEAVEDCCGDHKSGCVGQSGGGGAHLSAVGLAVTDGEEGGEAGSEPERGADRGHQEET